MEKAFLIVGLGNPGAKYARTRHNVGFQLVDFVAEKWKVRWSNESKFTSVLGRTERNGSTVLLQKPQTFMNASGEAVGPVSAFYKVSANRVIVAVDDADLPLGEIRLRKSGSSGGHHGLESIESHLGTRDFPRLRIGIGRAQDGRREISGYVLAPFSAEESLLMERILDRAFSQLECCLNESMDKAMSQYNGLIKSPE
jgi:PTH1 family peptidyl-tRNA hydrolase